VWKESECQSSVSDLPHMGRQQKVDY
jgi:hypothetical protein